MDDWPSVTLRDLVTIRHGFAFQGEYFCDDPTRFSLVTPGNFAIGGGFVANAKYYDGPIPEDFVLTAGDLIVTMTDLSKSGDTLGFSAVVPSSEGVTFLHNQRVGRVELLRSERATLRFLQWVTRSRPYREEVLAGATGTTVRHTSPSRISAYSFRLPPLHEQHAIADVLEALDDKIECNRRLSATCRELVRLELDARENDTWLEVPVSSLASFVNGGAYTKGASGTGRMVVRIAELSKGAGGSTIYNDIDVPDGRVARPGDLLMAWSGSLGVHVWLGGEAIVNQHIFKVLPKGVPAWLVYDRLERAMPEFRQIAADKATTMGHIKRHHLDDVRVRVPVGSCLAELDGLVSPCWSRAIVADLESGTLGELRDGLLPELLSGRLRVPIAEERIEPST